MFETRLIGLSWSWIALSVTLPSVVGLVAAYPFWRKGGMIFGNIAGTAVMFGWAFAMIMREYVGLDRLVQQCIDDGGVCWAQPGDFTRFAVYATIGLLEVFALFWYSLLVEARRRSRDYAPEWR